MPDLMPFPEDWERGLAIVAHPDDLEYGTASAIRRWTDQGKKMAYLLLTKGEAGIEGMDPEITALVREQEEYRSAAIVGVDDVTFLNFPDSALENTPDMQQQISDVIGLKQPELLLTFNHHPTWPGGSPNSTDHIATGQAIIAAMQGHDMRYWAVWGSEYLSHAVDIKDTFEAGVLSLQQHEQYLAGLTPVPDARQVLTKDALYVANRAGLELAVGFELVTF